MRENADIDKYYAFKYNGNMSTPELFDRENEKLNKALEPHVERGEADAVSNQLRQSLKRFETSFGRSPTALPDSMREQLIDEEGLVIPAPNADLVRTDVATDDQEDVHEMAVLGDDGHRWDQQLELDDK